jgi:hypothetical protein
MYWYMVEVSCLQFRAYFCTANRVPDDGVKYLLVDRDVGVYRSEKVAMVA